MKGTGVYPHVEITKIGNRAFDSSQKALVVFDDLNPNATDTKKITVENKSSIPIEFHWNFSHKDNSSESESNFSIWPTKGKFKPSQSIEFSLQFKPTKVAPYFSNIRLLVDGILRPENEDHPLFEKYYRQLDSTTLAANSTGSATELDPMNFFNTKKDSVAYPRGKLTSDEHNVSIPIIDLQVHGNGREFDVCFDPPVLMFGSAIVVNKPTQKAFTIINSSESAVPFRWEVESNDTISYEENPFCPIPTGSFQPKIKVRFEPRKGKIEAGEAKQITFTIMPLGADEIEETILCEFASSFFMPLHISAKVEGPRLRIEDPAIDFGLVQVGAEVSAPVTIKNLSSITLHWRFVSLSDSALDNNASDSSCPSSTTEDDQRSSSSST